LEAVRMRKFVLGYLLPRLAQWAMVIFIGVTVTFVIPHMSPNDPVERQVGVLMNSGAYFSPAAIIEMRQALTEMYGLQGSAWDQYLAFWGRLFRADFGPSLSTFPTPVTQLIARAMPWTIGLLATAVLISFVLGNALGAIASYYPENRLVGVIDVLSQAVRPIPYYVMALVMLIMFAYVVKIFPFSGAYAPGTKVELTPSFIATVIWHSMLPALTLVILGMGGWFLGMKSLASNIISEDYVVYVETAGLSKPKILRNYIVPNAMLPQITGLAMSLGSIFSGALILEVVFGYPGMGTLTFQAVMGNDYSLIMGIAIFSIVGVATAVLILDLLYPLFDPRVRYQ
jgi:peptide/nickel transport system permease protein